MRRVMATELARNLSRVLDRLATDGEEVVIERNQREIARIVPGPANQTAIEAMADLYRVLPEDAARTWERDGRRTKLKGQKLGDGVRNPWDS